MRFLLALALYGALLNGSPLAVTMRVVQVPGGPRVAVWYPESHARERFLAGAWESWRDPRIRAVLVFAPYAKPFLIHECLASLGAPVTYQGAYSSIVPKLMEAFLSFRSKQINRQSPASPPPGRPAL